MVNYMWGKDVADALLANQGLPADPNDKDDFDVSAADIERALQDQRDRYSLSRWQARGNAYFRRQT